MLSKKKKSLLFLYTGRNKTVLGYLVNCKTRENKFFIDRKILKNVIEELHTFEQYKVVLLDDIITTGATLESAATIIIKTLKVPIHAITLAMD